MQLAQIKEESNNTSLNNAYPRFYSRTYYLAANSFYIIPGNTLETSPNNYDFASDPADATGDPVNRSDPSGMCTVKGASGQIISSNSSLCQNDMNSWDTSCTGKYSSRCFQPNGVAWTDPYKGTDTISNVLGCATGNQFNVTSDLQCLSSGYACSSNPGGGTQGGNYWEIPAVTRWNNVVECVLPMLNLPATTSYVSAVDILIWGESYPKGNPNSINNWDINWKEGHPSSGLLQVIQPTFDEYRSPLLMDNLFDPAANIFAGLDYGIHKYNGFWNIPGIKSVLNGGPYHYYSFYSGPSSCGTSV